MSVFLLVQNYSSDKRLRLVISKEIIMRNNVRFGRCFKLARLAHFVIDWASHELWPKSELQVSSLQVFTLFRHLPRAAQQSIIGEHVRPEDEGTPCGPRWGPWGRTDDKYLDRTAGRLVKNVFRWDWTILSVTALLVWVRRDNSLRLSVARPTWCVHALPSSGQDCEHRHMMNYSATLVFVCTLLQIAWLRQDSKIPLIDTKIFKSEWEKRWGKENGRKKKLRWEWSIMSQMFPKVGNIGEYRLSLAYCLVNRVNQLGQFWYVAMGPGKLFSWTQL